MRRDRTTKGKGKRMRNRAAIYARFSTDLQDDRSIEDQIAICREYARRNDLVVVETYDDRASSAHPVQ